MTINNGIWPTMLTPFRDGAIDYSAVSKMTEWYLENGVDGLFAVCQSSEMFYLSLDERIELASFVQKEAAGRVQVIASGHISDSTEDQIEEIKRIADTGISAFVLVSNRLAKTEESDDVAKRNIEMILNRTRGITFGLYECPYPYKRLLTPALLKWCADTGRFAFLKDTCCDVDMLRKKLDAVKGTGLKIFNANSATLLESLHMGGAGFCGVMANIHPRLYVYLYESWQKEPEKARFLQNFLTMGSWIERQFYPVNAKYHMNLAGVPMSLESRCADSKNFSPLFKSEVEQLYRLSEYVLQKLGQKMPEKEKLA